jgi:N,N'-diacetyllegionaminate synthase
MKIGNAEIGNGKPVYVICEGGVTNYGDFHLGKQQVDAAFDAKADCIKFQAWKTEELVSRAVADRLQPELKFNWFQRLKEKEFTFAQIADLFHYARERGIDVFATPHDEVALEFLDSELHQEVFKIGSGEAHNERFLRAVGSARKPVIISFGFQTDSEISRAIETLDRAGAPEIVALHCVSLYPTPYEYGQLRRIEHLRKLLGIPIGISDHSVGWHVLLAAVSLGACVIEKHLTFDQNDPRSLDNPGALLPEEFKTLVRQVRDVEKALCVVPESERERVMQKPRTWLGQCLVANQEISLGTVLTEEMIAFKRPSLHGLPPSALPLVLGKRIKKLVKKDEQILLENLE